jgi:hypothetical protein
LNFIVLEIVPQTIQEEMQTIYVSLSELLRHFWSSFPPSSPQIEEKVCFPSFWKNMIFFLKLDSSCS